MYPYLLKRKLTWRFVQLPNSMTTSQNCFLYYLSVWKIFSKNSFFFAVSRGVPLDCGCKGRHFLQTDQTIRKVFFKKFQLFILSVWFTPIARKTQIYKTQGFWHLRVTKHTNKATKQKDGKEEEGSAFPALLKNRIEHINITRQYLSTLGI